MRRYNQVIKDTFGDTPVIGVEVGVHWGRNSEEILDVVNAKMLYLVDGWSKEVNDKWSKRVMSESSGWGDRALTHAYNNVKLLFDRVQNVIICKAESVVAAEQFPDETFDFIYIDAAHTEFAVYEDCKAWYPKLKKGGVFGGHDFVLQDVKRAVTRFASEVGREVKGGNGSHEDAGMDWWFPL